MHVKQRTSLIVSPSVPTFGLSSAPRAFTLIEVLIVVIILGVLAAMVMPNISSAAGEARQAALRDNLRHLRMQVLLYRAQHNGVAPGYPQGDTQATPTADALVEQLTKHSSLAGQTSSTRHAEFQFGPYLQGIPVNPFTQRFDVRVLPDDATFPTGPVGPESWLYQPATGTIVANLPGADATGRPYFDY